MRHDRRRRLSENGRRRDHGCGAVSHEWPSAHRADRADLLGHRGGRHVRRPRRLTAAPGCLAGPRGRRKRRQPKGRRGVCCCCWRGVLVLVGPMQGTHHWDLCVRRSLRWGGVDGRRRRRRGGAVGDRLVRLTRRAHALPAAAGPRWSCGQSRRGSSERGRGARCKSCKLRERLPRCWLRCLCGWYGRATHTS